MFNPLLHSGIQFGPQGVPTVADSTERLALSPVNGYTVLQRDTNILYSYNSGTATWYSIGGPGSINSVGAFQNTSTPFGLSVLSGDIRLHAADGTNAGGVSVLAQEFAGIKTFLAAVYANGGVDVTATAGTDTLNIGATNANVINIGNSGASVNLYGNTFYQEVTNLQVLDKLFTVNKNGAAASGFGAGFEIEENLIITGYNKTSADRASWEFKAPNTSGIFSLTPSTFNPKLIASGTADITLPAATSSLATLALSEIFTNKTIDGDDNTIQDIGIASLKTVLADANKAIVRNGAGAVTSALILNVNIDSAAAIDFSKFAALTSGNILVGNVSNVATSVAMSGEATLANTGALTLTNSAVIGKVLTGFLSGSGALAATDTILQGFNKLDGNIGLKANIADPTFTTKITTPDLYISGESIRFKSNAAGSGADWMATLTRDTANMLAAAIITLPRATSTISTTDLAETFSAIKTFSVAPLLKAGIDIEDPGVGSNKVTLTAQTVSASYSLALPTAVATVASSALISDNSGNLSYALVKAASSGDLAETSFSAANNQAIAADITGLTFANATVRSFEAICSVFVNATASLYAIYTVHGIQKGASWEISSARVGDDAQITFSITSLGQVQYTSGNYAGFSAATMKFRAITTTV